MVGKRNTSTGVCYAPGFSDLPLASNGVTNPFPSFMCCISDNQDESEDNQAWHLSTTGSSMSPSSCRCSARHFPCLMAAGAPVSAVAGERGLPRFRGSVAPRSDVEFSPLARAPRRLPEVAPLHLRPPHQGRFGIPTGEGAREPERP